MDPSSLFAAVGSGIIFVVMYVASVVYVFSYNNKNSNHGVTDEDWHVYKWTFHVETLRFYAMIAFVLVLAFGAIVTEKSGLDTIQEPTETVIFKLFQFNHSCNWMDHNPARLISAILIVPFVQAPMCLYIIFWHSRLGKAVKVGKCPKWLLNASRILSPFNFIAMTQLHLWFVNNPDDTYGFTAHYIPYFTMQITICFIKILNLMYLKETNALPCGIPPTAAGIYVGFFSLITIVSAIMVITTLAGAPIIEAGRSSGELLFTNILSFSWAALGFVGTLVFAGIERKNGDNITLILGDDIISLETTNSPDDVEALVSSKKEEEEEGVLQDEPLQAAQVE